MIVCRADMVSIRKNMYLESLGLIKSKVMEEKDIFAALPSGQ
jgi:hypothetical protein